MARKVRKKIASVREHQMKVPVSKKNPTGTTVRDRHLRHLRGTFLDAAEISKIFETYDRKNVIFPAKAKLKKYKNADNYDDVIGVWSDYFNKKFSVDPLVHPDVIKALIASESSFDADPKQNRKIARGIAQITKETLKILQDPDGEVKSFIFQNIRLKDLADPYISIPMAIRWIHRKRETATGKLGRAPSHEELILEYKGLLRSNSEYKKSGLKKFREDYAELKK